MDFGTESLLGACVNLIEATSIFPLKIESNPFLLLIENCPDPSPPLPEFNRFVLFPGEAGSERILKIPVVFSVIIWLRFSEVTGMVSPVVLVPNVVRLARFAKQK